MNENEFITMMETVGMHRLSVYTWVIENDGDRITVSRRRFGSGKWILTLKKKAGSGFVTLKYELSNIRRVRNTFIKLINNQVII